MYLLLKRVGNQYQPVEGCSNLDHAFVASRLASTEHIFERQPDGTWYHADGFLIIHVVYRLVFQKPRASGFTTHGKKYESRKRANRALRGFLQHHPGWTGVVQKMVHRNRKPEVTQCTSYSNSPGTNVAS